MITSEKIQDFNQPLHSFLGLMSFGFVINKLLILRVKRFTCILNLLRNLSFPNCFFYQ